MNWAFTKNNKRIKISEIPVLANSLFFDEIAREYQDGKRIVLFFGVEEKAAVKVFAVLADDAESRLIVSSTLFKDTRKYPSLTKQIPAMHVFEREIWEEFGIVPEGNPWLKPIRYPHDRFDKTQKMENYPFFKMEGEEVHEVAVGPVHAGVIEPGHFRFMCSGEDVYHLEIQLGYQHRGAEKLFLGKNYQLKSQLAESIAGDTVIGHALAYSNIVESLCAIEVSKRANIIRAIALEMERAAIHIGDLGALANDVAYLIGNAVCGATRTLVINSLLAISGSRFGRGLIRPGGVVFDISSDLAAQIKQTLQKVYADVEGVCEEMFSAASVLSRFEKTGVVNNETAKSIGLVGMSARASGIPLDIRTDHPFGAYLYVPIHSMTLDGGDVFARAYIRYVEIKQSLNFVIECLDSLGDLDKNDLYREPSNQGGDYLTVSLVEGWRGEIAHAAISEGASGFMRYKIKDPSFHNWFGLALAVRNNGISDFPLCNKSFNLSYCGNDL